jgi:hypothetical protein
MHRVYWIEADEPRTEAFASDALSAALAFAESLRARRRAGDSVSFVTIASEDPAHVGEAGVADPPADYAWVKRRRPPARRPG